MWAAQGVPPSLQTKLLERWAPCGYVDRTGRASLDGLRLLLLEIVPSQLPHVSLRFATATLSTIATILRQ
jgi:hypothetical protein